MSVVIELLHRFRIEFLLRFLMRVVRNSTVAIAILCWQTGSALAAETSTNQPAASAPQIEAPQTQKPPVEQSTVTPEAQLALLEISADSIEIADVATGLAAKVLAVGNVLDTDKSDLHLVIQSFDSDMNGVTQAPYAVDLQGVHKNERRLLGGKVFHWEGEPGGAADFVVLQATLTRQKTNLDNDAVLSFLLVAVLAPLSPQIAAVVAVPVAAIAASSKGNEVIATSKVYKFPTPKKPTADQQVVVTMQNNGGKLIASISLNLHAKFAPPKVAPAPAVEQAAAASH